MGIYSTYLTEASIISSIKGLVAKLKRAKVEGAPDNHIASFSDIAKEIDKAPDLNALKLSMESFDYILNEYDASESDIEQFKRFVKAVQESLDVIMDDSNRLAKILDQGIATAERIKRNPKKFADELRVFRKDYYSYINWCQSTLTKQLYRKIYTAVKNLKNISAKFSMKYGDNSIAAKKEVDKVFAEIYAKMLELFEKWYAEDASDLKKLKELCLELTGEDPELAKQYVDIMGTAWKYLWEDVRFLGSYSVYIRRKLLIEKEGSIMYNIVKMIKG